MSLFTFNFFFQPEAAERKGVTGANICVVEWEVKIIMIMIIIIIIIMIIIIMKITEKKKKTGDK